MVGTVPEYFLEGVGFRTLVGVLMLIFHKKSVFTCRLW